MLFSDFNRSPFHYPLDLPGSLLHVAGRPPVNLYFSGVNANTVLEMALLSGSVFFDHLVPAMAR